jgi:hypothetical protein
MTAMTYRDFSRGLHQLTRTVTFAGLAISGVWGAWAWYWDQPDPLFHVVEVNSHPVVRAALVEVPDHPGARVVGEIRQLRVPWPNEWLFDTPTGLNAGHLTLDTLNLHSVAITCRSCVSPYRVRLYRCGDR